MYSYVVYEKTITIEVPKWIDEEEVRFWIAECIGRKMVRKLVLEALSENVDLTREEGELFEKQESLRGKIFKNYIKGRAS